MLAWIEIEEMPKFQETRHEVSWSKEPFYTVDIVNGGLISLDPTLFWEDFCERHLPDGQIASENTFEPEIINGMVYFHVRKRK